MTKEELLKIIDKAAAEEWKELDLSGNHLTELPPEIFQLTSLQRLDLSSNQISRISPEISQLTSLKRLDLFGNQISSIPPEISQLISIQQLHIFNNQISSIPPEISQLTSLQLIDLSHNQISSIPPEISQLTSLQLIDLSDNQINSIPAEIFQLTALQLMDLSTNKISRIPPEISQLNSLQRLDLASNKISNIPPEISQLISLQIVDFSSNKISNIPSEISQLNSLKFLSLSHNPLETPPMEVVEQGIEGIRNYFKILEAEGYDTIYEAKLIIVGEGESGKTSLMNKILDPNYLVPQPEESTHGISIKIFQFPLTDEQNYRVNMWDFGGQEIYHQTHQFFLTKRSLYVLVTNSRKEHDHLDYWLNIVEIFSDNSPMLIIKNEKDNCSVELKDESQIRGRFKNIVKEILTTDLAKNRGLDDIIKEIKYRVDKLPQVGIKIPKSWAKIRQAIEEDKRDYISLNQYLALCDDNEFNQQISFDDNNQNNVKDSRLKLSQFFHDLGIILHFQDDEASILYDTVILNPEWVTQAVYELLKRENNPIKKQSGKFTFSDLKEIWSDQRYQGKYRELLELMKRFKLCYELPNKTYISPQLLDINSPKYNWNRENNLKLRYYYEFMPKGIISRFIVEMHHYIDEPKVWRSGVILTKDNTYAEIIETYNQREIEINLVGNNKRGLLEVITAKFDEIHNSYQNLKVDKQIPCNCQSCQNSEQPSLFDFQKLKQRITHKKETIECSHPPYENIRILNLIDDTIGRENFLREELNTEFIKSTTTNLRFKNKSPHSSQEIDNIIEVIKLFTQQKQRIVMSQGNTYQNHSGNGDNVAGSVTNNTNYGNAGVAFNQGTINNQGTIAGVNNEAEQQNLIEAAKQIKTLLDQLSQQYPTNTSKEKNIVVGEVVDIVENDPNLKSRVINALKSGGIEAFKEAVNHPLVNILVATIDGWQTAE